MPKKIQKKEQEDETEEIDEVAKAKKQAAELIAQAEEKAKNSAKKAQPPTQPDTYLSWSMNNLLITPYDVRAYKPKENPIVIFLDAYGRPSMTCSVELTQQTMGKLWLIGEKMLTSKQKEEILDADKDQKA